MSESNNPENENEQQKKERLIKALLKNQISLQDLFLLRTMVDETDLSVIIQHIYDLNEKQVLELAAMDSLMRIFNNNKNSRRNIRFTKKIKAGFRNNTNTRRKIILAEGDSWFNYPIILTDVIDAISMDPDLAVYSLAEGENPAPVNFPD